MKLINVTAASLFLCFAGALAADPGTNPDPMQQASQSLKKNLNNQPSNQGLQKAFDQIKGNRKRFDAKHEETSAGGGRSRAEERSRVEKVNTSQSQRADQVERLSRPERPERVERVEAQALIERPGNSELGRSHRR